MILEVEANSESKTLRMCAGHDKVGGADFGSAIAGGMEAENKREGRKVQVIRIAPRGADVLDRPKNNLEVISVDSRNYKYCYDMTDWNRILIVIALVAQARNSMTTQ